MADGGAGLGRGGPGGETRRQHAAAVARVRQILGARGIPLAHGSCVGSTIYGAVLDADVDVLRRPPGEDYGGQRVAGVIVRWQGSAGSADQKLAHLYLSVEQGFAPVLLVLDGEGWSRGSLEWVLRQRGVRFLGAVRLDDLDAWCATWQMAG